MKARLLAFLSRDWAGLAASLAFLAVACSAALATTGAARAIASAIAVAALLLGVGAVMHLVDRARVRRRFPPPGNRHRSESRT